MAQAHVILEEGKKAKIKKGWKPREDAQAHVIPSPVLLVSDDARGGESDKFY